MQTLISNKMIKHVGHGGILRRIAINVGAGYLPGINTIITGASQAAGQLGWEIVGIRDGFEGLLHPDRYPDGGLVTLSPQMAAAPWISLKEALLARHPGSILLMTPLIIMA